MKKLVVVLMMAVFAAQFTDTVSFRMRRAADDEDSGVFSMLNTGLGIIESLPIFGGIVKFFADWLVGLYTAIEDLTNGLIARFLGGAMPCILSLENGIQCTGITKDNTLATHLIKVIDQTPLPGFIKGIIGTLLKVLLDPTTNIIFGGVPVSRR